jgi:hypothetical protein
VLTTVGVRVENYVGGQVLILRPQSSDYEVPSGEATRLLFWMPIAMD